MNPNHCPTCRANIPANAPHGFCPACLLRDAEEAPPPGRSAPALAEIASAFPQWEILALIGQGGMGAVYQVRQPGLDRTVALKILAPELARDPAFAERFAREARTLGKLNHPNIVSIFEHGESGGFFYLVMEYVDGVNLRQAMRTGRFTPEQALAIVPGICDALQAAHAQGVWHRDIKPENILLDRNGQVKIADFGIARIIGDPQRDFTLTLTGNALGSAAYMAPEQLEKPHDVDHRADIYSLGVVIYEMLTGELPLGRFPSPSRKAAVDARIDEIVLRTLEKERELRQQSAAEVKTDVHQATQARQAAESLPERKSPPVSVAFPDIRLALGLWIGGLAGVAAGLFTTPLLLGLGLVAAALGLAACCWILRKIQQGAHPRQHRLPLLVMVYWPLVLGLAWMATLLWFYAFKIKAASPDPAPMKVALYGFSILALSAPLILGRILWNLLGKDATQSAAKRFEVTRALAAALLVISGLLLVKWVQEREHAYRAYRSTFIQFSHEIRWPEDAELIRRAVKTALPEDLTRYRTSLLAPGDPGFEAFSFGAESPFLVLETSLADGGEHTHDHFRAATQRLRASLPKRIGVNAGPWGGADDKAPTAIREGSRRVRPWNFAILMTPLLAVLLSVASRRPVAWMLAALTLFSALCLVNSPAFPLPPGLPPSMDGMPPPPPLPLPEYDFSTPRDAIESMIQAANKGDVDAFKRGVSRELLERMAAETSDWSEPMRETTRVRYAGQISRSDGVAIIQMLTDGRKHSVKMILEDGEWKLSPDPVE